MDPQVLGVVRKLCKDPRQLEMLNWIESQPQPVVEQFLMQTVASMPREQIAPTLNEQLGDQATPEEKQHLYTQLIQVYDFLKAQQAPK
jgi:hypothetical protein